MLFVEVLKGGKGDMKRHHRLEQPTVSQSLSSTPVALSGATSSKPTKDANSASEEVVVSAKTPVATNGWWNGWGWW